MLKEKLMEDLKDAMKNKEINRKNTVQMVRAAILQVEKDKKIELDDNQILEVIAKEFKKRNELDSLSLAGLSIAASGVNLLVPGILSVTAFLDR